MSGLRVYGLGLVCRVQGHSVKLGRPYMNIMVHVRLDGAVKAPQN